MKGIVLSILFLPALLYPQKNYVEILPTDTEADIIEKAANVVPSPRQLRWQQLEMTAFFHFGINTFTNKEWGNGKEDITLFNPTSLDAKQWVQIAKEAGFKQIILTAKHHDGFCLWPSKYTDHTIKNTPYKNGNGDVVKEVAEACKSYAIGFGIYLSPWDMNSALYGDYEKYNRFFINQLTELLTNYGKIDEVWFDGANGEGPNGKKQEYNFNAWYQTIRDLQPSATIAVMGPDIRWVGTETGVGRETEWSVVPVEAQSQEAIANNSQSDVAFSPKGDMMGNDLGSRDKILKAEKLVWYPAETDVSIRPGWFYHPEEDNKVKSADDLMNIYFSSVGRNGVLLLNIPPNKQGLISDSDAKSLREWKIKHDAVFSHNLLKNATASSVNGINTSSLIDGNFDTYFTTINKSPTTTIEFALNQNSTFNILMIQENIAKGQRVEKFYAEYFENGSWIKFTEGTTVGYKRLLSFDAISADKIRIHIESSRLNPMLSEVGLFYQTQ